MSPPNLLLLTYWRPAHNHDQPHHRKQEHRFAYFSRGQGEPGPMFFSFSRVGILSSHAGICFIFSSTAPSLQLFYIFFCFFPSFLQLLGPSSYEPNLLPHFSHAPAVRALCPFYQRPLVFILMFDNHLVACLTHLVFRSYFFYFSLSCVNSTESVFKFFHQSSSSLYKFFHQSSSSLFKFLSSSPNPTDSLC
jgi:hypothetical protein